MPYPRKQTYLPGDEATFHVYCHSVHPQGFRMRRPENEYPDDHRKEWVVARLDFLCRHFAVRLHTYAILDNHYHLVIGVAPRMLESRSDQEILDCWLEVYPGRKDRKGKAQPLTPEERARRLADKSLMDSYREKLGNLSAFMKALNHHIARKVFHEQKSLRKDEQIVGHFFNRRFQSKRITESKGGLLGVMLYVDLNEIRAGIAKVPEDSRYSGISRRLAGRCAWIAKSSQLVPMDEILDCGEESMQTYLQFLDAAGRQHRDGKASIDPRLAPILDRLQLNRARWAEHVQRFPDLFHRVIGPANEVRKLGQRLGTRFRAVRLLSKAKASRNQEHPLLPTSRQSAG